jgi:hypothetical protein
MTLRRSLYARPASFRGRQCTTGAFAGANDGEEGSGGVVADIATLSVGREAYIRELATDHQAYLSGHGQSPGRWYGAGASDLGSAEVGQDVAVDGAPVVGHGDRRDGRTCWRHSSQRSPSSATVRVRLPRCSPRSSCSRSWASTFLASRQAALVWAADLAAEPAFAAGEGSRPVNTCTCRLPPRFLITLPPDRSMSFRLGKRMGNDRDLGRQLKVPPRRPAHASEYSIAGQPYALRVRPW